MSHFCMNCMHEISDADAFCPFCGFDVNGYRMQAHHLRPETILKGRYVLGRVLGEGGFGITYVALDLHTAQKLAIKELFVKGLLERSMRKTVLINESNESKCYYAECKEKFLQEAYLLQQMRDKKGIVDIQDFFEENRTAYIVMEFLDGEDLLAHLKKLGGKISFEEAWKLLEPAMKSLIELHRMGVFHRDISPDNIRCLPNGEVKIMDLGGAKTNALNAHSSIVALKKGYAPPEQYSIGYKIGPWMDEYALAATFYRCITGKVPPESGQRLEQDTLVPPRSLGAEITEEEEKVILKALNLSVEERFVDVSEFYTELKQAREKKNMPMDSDEKPSEFWENDEYKRMLEEIQAASNNKISMILSGGVTYVIVVLMILIITYSMWGHLWKI